MKPSLCNEGHFNAQEQLSLQVFEKDTEFAATSEVRPALHKCGTWRRKRAELVFDSFGSFWGLFAFTFRDKLCPYPIMDEKLPALQSVPLSLSWRRIGVGNGNGDGDRWWDSQSLAPSPCASGDGPRSSHLFPRPPPLPGAGGEVRQEGTTSLARPWRHLPSSLDLCPS